MAEVTGSQLRDATPSERAVLDRRRPRDPLWRDVLGTELRRLRHDRQETLGEIARRAGVSLQYLSEIERGRKEPSSEMIAAVAGALDVTLVDLTLAVATAVDGPRSTSATRPAPAVTPPRASVLALAA